MIGRTICVFLMCTLYVYAADEGEPCSNNGVGGVCKNIRHCPTTADDINNRNGSNIYICGFKNLEPVVCCVDNAVPLVITARPPVATTSTKRPSTTTEYELPEYVYEDIPDTSLPQGCDPIPANKTSPRTGQKAWDKCIEYQEQLVYPCVKGAAGSGKLTRVDLCGQETDEVVTDGADNASDKDLRHIVLLGYGDKTDKAEWLCGGSLISDRFVLTAGHCTAARVLGPASFVIIGAWKQVDSSRVYKIKKIHKHPDFKPPIKYNDIGLLETERQMKLDLFAIPACLHVGDRVDDEKAFATGWGSLYSHGPVDYKLKKLTLTKVPHAECAKKYPPQRTFKQGIDPRTHICYGDPTVSTCQTNGGSPLQIKSKSIYCMYVVIGVTSFSKGCGMKDDPEVYTRVAPYIPWIESIVWP